jgi:alanyl-tRNA synthetase
VATARLDYTTLTESAGLFSSHIRELPQQVQKSLLEVRAAAKVQQKLLEEIAEFHAERLLARTTAVPRIITAVYPEREAIFVKLLAQKLTASGPNVVALLASGAGQVSLVFAQSPGRQFNMGQLMKETMAMLGGRGGGSADMAQGGLPAGSSDMAHIEKLLQETAAKL